jgi:hypothetical protein
VTLAMRTMTSHPGLNQPVRQLNATPSTTPAPNSPAEALHPNRQSQPFPIALPFPPYPLPPLTSQSYTTDSKMPPKARAEPSAAATMKKQYLISYNAISATLWFGVLARVAMHAAAGGVGNGRVYDELERYTRLVQTGAGLEVVHSLLGTLLFLE